MATATLGLRSSRLLLNAGTRRSVFRGETPVKRVWGTVTGGQAAITVQPAGIRGNRPGAAVQYSAFTASDTDWTHEADVPSRPVSSGRSPAAVVLEIRAKSVSDYRQVYHLCREHISRGGKVLFRIA